MRAKHNPDFDDWGGEDSVGGWRAGLRRLFSQGDNPMLWGVPLANVAKIRVRVGALLLVFVAAELVDGAIKSHLMYTALMMAMLVVVVVLHEFGHCLACRAVEGEADEILLWPLGGLAMCRPPHLWRAHLVTTAGGPLVNLVLLPVTALGVVASVGHWGAVWFNPFKPMDVLTTPEWFGNWWQVAVWWLHYTNMVVLAFNVLLPMFPLDGGRLWQALLWRKLGYHRSMAIAVNVGLATAVAVGVVAIISQQNMLMGVAAFGGIVCYFERKKLMFMAEGEPEADNIFAKSLASRFEEETESEAVGPSRAEQSRREKEAADQVEVDRILAKIASTGMASLTRAEKKALERATQAKRTTGQ